MRNSPHTLRRTLHFVLVLLMLASQGIASTHELCPDDVGDYHDCSICALGHGMGAALPVASFAPAVVEFSAVQVAMHIAGDLRLFHREYYSKRAPPSPLISS
jgi:hypothetical protein